MKSIMYFSAVMRSTLYALLCGLFLFPLTSSASNADEIYIYLVSKFKTINQFEERLYDALSNEFTFVGISWNNKILRKDSRALYIVGPGTSVQLSSPKQGNIFILKTLEDQTAYSASPGVDISPKIGKVQQLLGSVFNGSYKLGFISEDDGTPKMTNTRHFVTAKFEAGRDPFKAVNRLINYNRIDALLLSDNITDRATRRKIFISCLEQNRFAIGTKRTDVEDGALASIYYDDGEIVDAVAQGIKQYRTKRLFDLSLIEPKIKIKVNRSLAKARNIPSVAFHLDSAVTTYE